MGPGIPNTQAGSTSIGSRTIPTYAPNCWFRFSASNTASSLRRETSLLRFDRANGDFAVWAYERHKLPISPLHYTRILGDEHAELERMGDAFAGLPDWRPQIVRRAIELKAELGRLARDDAAVQQAINAVVGRLNA